MKPEDFDLFMHIVKQRSGIVLTRDKAYFIESRLTPVARKYNLKSLEEVAQAIRSSRDEKMMADVTECVTTNETRFFRDRKLFLEFQKVILPQILAARSSKRQIRIWSAAASSGQEAYSLAMMLAEEAEKLENFNVEIIATDISKDMVARAQKGIYTQFEVQLGLPIRMLVKYFQQLGPDKWQIKDAIRQKIQFKEGNLLHDLGPVGTFDVIFCRNILTYFDEPTRTRVLDAITSVMATDGVLLLGRSETAGGSPRVKALSEDNGFYALSHGPGFTMQQKAG